MVVSNAINYSIKYRHYHNIVQRKTLSKEKACEYKDEVQ